MVIKLLLDIFLYVFLCACVYCAIMYFPRFKAWFASFKKQTEIKNEKNNKLALVIPARNESSVIDTLLNCIEKQTYPKEYFDVHILVKEKDDPTIELAKRVNAIVHVVDDQTCKGDALDACFKKALNETPNLYDAFIIVDADCMIDDKFLEEMNNAMASGAQVISAKKIVKNYLSKNKKANSLSSCCNGLIWTIIDDMGNRYKSDRKITNMTIGTGVLIRADVVKELGGWTYRQTLTEDMELMYDCAVKGYSTFYYSYAKIYVEEATSLKVTNKRRSRWLNGLIDSKRIYAKRLRKSAVTKEAKINKYYTTALSPVFIYVWATLVFFATEFIFSVVLFILGNKYWIYGLSYALGSVLLLYFAFFFLTVVCLIVDRKHIKLPWYKKVAVAFAHPVFYMGYIPIIAKALFFKYNKGWEVIERVAVLSNN